MGHWKHWLRNKLLPTIRPEFVMVLFLVLLFHAHYFGEEHVMVRKLFALQPKAFWLLLWAYGLLVLALNLMSVQDTKQEAKANRREELRRKYRPEQVQETNEQEEAADPIAWFLLLGSALGHSWLMGALAITMKRPTPWDLAMLFYAITQCGLALYYILFPLQETTTPTYGSRWYDFLLYLGIIVGATLLLENFSTLRPMAITTSLIAGAHVFFEVRRRWQRTDPNVLSPQERGGLP